MTGKVNSIPDGFHTVTPYLMVQEAAQLIDFVKQAFGATELMRTTGSAGGIHAEVRIGDSVVMIGGGGAWSGEAMPAAIHLYMDDVDAVYKRALQAGENTHRTGGPALWGSYGGRKGRVRQRMVHCHAQGGRTLVGVAANAPAHVRQ